MAIIIINVVKSGTVRALFVKPEKGGKPIPLETADVSAAGLAGDYHTGSASRRQILLMSGAILDELGLQPGSIFENVVVDGFDVMSLVQGQRVRIGSALCEVTIPCTPCVQMDRVRRGLRALLEDRRGMFVRVVETGAVHVGDSIHAASDVH